MDIGKEHDKEIWITAPDETPVEQPAPALPNPAESPLVPTEVPA